MAGHKILAGGGSSLDAVEAAVVIFEDSPQFNAGKGAVFTHEGTNELDAAIMDGRTMMAGAVAGVKRVKNPIRLARLVMEKSPHVMMVGEGAEAFGKEQGGIEFVPESYFHTDLRWQQLQRALEEEKSRRGAALAPRRGGPGEGTYFGTVGAVALDRQRNLAAATSTGGLTNKRFGRVGDSPIIGAGTYADNRACAVSGTGLGEAFIRAAVAYDVSARLRYSGVSLATATAAALRNVADLGGDGGLIAVDRRGNVAMPFNSEGMYRACIDRRGRRTLAIF
jgi:beta-aspartyl-peptidase (threonine type)